MLRITEPLLIQRVLIRALRPTFFLGSRVAEVGETAELDLGDATMLEKSGKAEILGPAPPRYLSVADLQPPKPWRPKW